MAGIGALNPVQRRSTLGTPNISGVAALLGTQNKSLEQAVDAVTGFNQAGRADDITQEIEGMDLSTATPADIAQLRGGQSLTPQMEARLKELGMDAENIQKQGFRESEATTLFGRQKELQSIKDANAMARTTKSLGETAESMTPEMYARLSDEVRNYDIALQRKDLTPMQKAELLKAKDEIELRVAQQTGGMKSTSGIKNRLFEGIDTGTGEIGSFKVPDNPITGKAFKPTEILTGDLGKAVKNSNLDPFSQSLMMQLQLKGANFHPIYDEYEDKLGKKHKTIKGYGRSGKLLNKSDLTKMGQHFGLIK